MKILKNVANFFKKIIKFFEPAEGTSYWHPILKLAIGILLAILAGSREKIFSIFGITTISTEAAILSSSFHAFLYIISTYLLVIPFSDFITVSENREKARKKKAPPQEAQCVEKTFDEIIQLAEKNDIIEIEIVSGGKLLTIGTSSDTDKPFGNMIDKKYYVEKCEYDKIEDFSEAINPLFKDGVVLVYSIDGIRLKKKKQPKK